MTSPFDFSSGAVITAAQLNAIADFESWTPSWTNLTVGSATVQAQYAQINELVFWQLEFTGASDTVYSTSGPFQFTLPVNSVSDLQYPPMGTGWLRPDKSGTLFFGQVVGISSTTAGIYCQAANATFSFAHITKSNAPDNWLTSGNLADMQLSGWYKVA